MKLYIKQKAFSWNDKFTVKDEHGQDAYRVEGEIFSLGKKLHVYDHGGIEVAFIEQKVFSFKPRYYIHIGNHTYEMVKDFTMLRQSYRLEGYPWQLEGNFIGHEYTLVDGNQPLMQVYKEWFTWGDSYALDFADPQYALLYLCMLLVIDCAVASANNS